VAALYRHTQVGWWIVIMGVTIPVLLIAGTWPPELSTIIPAALLLLPVAVFSRLIVTVSREAVEAAFGFRVVKRRVPLDHIRGWRIVHSPLHHGIGMRLIPNGTLYNVRSGPAVELLLENDRVLRIGTDQPQRLVDALAQVRTPPIPDYPSVAVNIRFGARYRAALLAIIVLPLVFIVIMMRASEKPPRVTLSNDGMTISSGLYSVDLPWSSVTDVSLEQTIPRVIGRTNGYALGSTVRGYFRVEGLGPVRLFVELDDPPFVRITSSTEGVIYVGLGGGTRQLFREITGVRNATR
jgi:hypothetical protein